MITQLILPEEVLSLAFSLDDPISPIHVRKGRIEIAQLKYIRPAFGNAMYQKMRAGDYDQFVVDYIKPALAHYVRSGMIGELAVRVGEYGVVRPSSEHSLQISSATKNDQQNRTDDLEENLSRLDATEKDVQDEATKTIIDSSKTMRTTDDVSMGDTIDQYITAGTSSSRFTSDTDVFEHTDVPTSMFASESGTTDISGDTGQEVEDVSKKYEDARNISYSEVSNDTQNIGTLNIINTTDVTEISSLVTKNGTGTTTLKSEDSGIGNTNRTSLEAATTEEWKLLAHKALQDARVFLRYAVDYVEANAGQFPDYAPVSSLGASIDRRRCIGGIVL